MSDYSILTGSNVPEVPNERKIGRYEPLLAQARKAEGEWVSLRAENEEAAGKLSGLGSRINKGKIKGAEEGEFEARVSIKKMTLWLRYLGPVEVEDDDPTEEVADEEPQRAPNPITGAAE